MTAAPYSPCPKPKAGPAPCILSSSNRVVSDVLFASLLGASHRSGTCSCAVWNAKTTRDPEHDRMSGKRQRTTFAKNQREKARMEKAAAKRARRLARKDGGEGAETTRDTRDDEPTAPASPDETPSV